MFRKKSSVQISIEGRKDKNLEIPTFVIKYWKHVSLSVLSIICLLIGSLTYFATQTQKSNLSSQYEASLDKVNEQNRKLSMSESEAQQNIIEAKKSFEKIDSTLERINEKMKKRGLKTIALANAGGPIEDDPNNLHLLTDYYEDAFNELEKKLSSLPIRVPHHGKVTSGFGYRANPFTRQGRELHSGVDLRGNVGEPIKSTANGIVLFAGRDGQYGNVVKIKHANGYETRYAHLLRTSVKKGQRVEAGSIVGLLGNTGRSTGPHLHYEILKNDKKINPEKYFTLLD